MDLDAISGPKQSDQPYIPIVSDEPGEIVDSRALILKDEPNPFESMYKWDVQDRVTISSEARRRYRELIVDAL